MRTEKKLLNKEALRTIKGGWGFTLPSTEITAPASTATDTGSTDEGNTDSGETTEEVSVIDVGAPPATAAPPSFKMGF